MSMLYAVELSELEPADQAKIRSFMHQHRRVNPNHNYLTDHPWVGQRIWRPVDKVSWDGQLVRVPWDDLLIKDSVTRSVNPVPVKVLRAHRIDDREWIARDADAHGKVCLCFDPVPADWTYFEVLKVHFLERSLIVRPVVGDRQELFRMF